jgi:hypothetical protein
MPEVVMIRTKWSGWIEREVAPCGGGYVAIFRLLQMEICRAYYVENEWCCVSFEGRPRASLAESRTIEEGFAVANEWLTAQKAAGPGSAPDPGMSYHALAALRTLTWGFTTFPLVNEDSTAIRDQQGTPRMRVCTEVLYRLQHEGHLDQGWMPTAKGREAVASYDARQEHRPCK